MIKQYCVVGGIPKWDFLIGYSCKSKSKDHFLRHLSYRFPKMCSILALDNAHYSNELIVDILDGPPVLSPGFSGSNHITVVSGYLSPFGYTLELNHGSYYYPIIEHRIFSSYAEAREWVVDNV